MKIQLVSDLITHLQKLDPDKQIIVAFDDDTFPLDTTQIQPWNPDDKDSPIAILV
jgi:hypothetical protein